MKPHLIFLLFVCCFGIHHNATCQDDRPSYEIRYVELYNEGVSFYGEHNYNSAINSYTKAIEIIDENLGKEHPDYARSLSNLLNQF